MCAARARTPTRGSRLRASADSNGPRGGRVGRNVVSTTATCARTPNARRDRRKKPEQRVHSSRAGHVSPSPHTRRGSDACVRQPRQTRHVGVLPTWAPRRSTHVVPATATAARAAEQTLPGSACPTPHPSLRPATLAPAPRPPAARQAPLVTHTSSGRAAPAQTLRRSTVFPAARSGRRRYVATRRGGAQTHVANLSTLPHGASEPPGSKPGHPGAARDRYRQYTPVLRSFLLIAWHTVHIHSSASWLAGCVCASTVGWLVESRVRRAGCAAMPRSASE